MLCLLLQTFVPDAFRMIGIHLLQSAVGGTQARTPKAVIRLAPNKGRTLPLLELLLELPHNRRTRHIVGDVCAAWDRVRPARWLIVMQKQLFALYKVARLLTYPYADRATGASYRGTMTPAIRRKLAMAGECTNNTPTFSAVGAVQAAHL